MSSAYDILRQGKHAAFVASKKARSRYRTLRTKVDDSRFRRAEARSPYVYDERYYAHTFLLRRSIAIEPGQVPPRLWAFWLNDESGLSEARRAAIASLRSQTGLEVRIVRSPDEVLIADQPFHPALADLHSVHRSDYLRAYVMHHYGGVYADIKQIDASLSRLVESMNADPQSWVTAYREVTSDYVPELASNLGDHIKRHYRAVMGPSAFVCRPHSPFTAEWMRELDARLDYYRGALAEAQASEASPYTAPADYPIRWTEICGDIIQPLSMKYQDHVTFDESIRPHLRGYR